MKLWDLSGYSEKSNIQEAYLPKTSISGLAQLCSDDSIQILLKKQFSIFLSCIRLQKQHSSRMYWLKMCTAWVRRQLRWAWNWLKLKVTSSNVLRIIIHWLSACRDVGLTQGSLTTKEHSLYRALKIIIIITSLLKSIR